MTEEGNIKKFDVPEEEHVKKSAVREEGVVREFNDAKGYGFITRERGPDIFVHHSSIIADGFRTLGEGDRVSFIVAPSRNKNIPLQATQVMLIS